MFFAKPVGRAQVASRATRWGALESQEDEASIVGRMLKSPEARVSRRAESSP